MITNELINKSIDYIIQHIEEEISIQDVANYCHLSKYYFSRVFKKATGESVYAFIKRLKMEQSAIRLKTEKDKTITDIGLEYGYSSSNFSSAFSKHLDISPAEYRKSLNTTCVLHPFYQNKAAEFPTLEDYRQRTQIQELDDIVVIYERHIGNYMELEKKWRDFMEKYKDYIKEDTLMIERAYDDPSVTTNLEQCLYDICITVDKNCSHEKISHENVMKIPGGKFAVYRFDGYVQDIFTVFQGLFHIWLSQSGYVMRERYSLGIYRAMDRINTHVVMDLCIPVKQGKNSEV